MEMEIQKSKNRQIHHQTNDESGVAHAIRTGMQKMLKLKNEPHPHVRDKIPNLWGVLWIFVN